MSEEQYTDITVRLPITSMSVSLLANPDQEKCPRSVSLQATAVGRVPHYTEMQAVDVRLPATDDMCALAMRAAADLKGPLAVEIRIFNPAPDFCLGIEATSEYVGDDAVPWPEGTDAVEVTSKCVRDTADAMVAYLVKGHVVLDDPESRRRVILDALAAAIDHYKAIPTDASGAKALPTDED